MTGPEDVWTVPYGYQKISEVIDKGFQGHEKAIDEPLLCTGTMGPSVPEHLYEHVIVLRLKPEGW
ncbi:hypothetical protein [uncultured Cohaesibacter sp.]|uniref:hypothetical protein n=1 Tax=uncultured Cohaesibacter sp. TaxID=1002546 RepID=UPI0029C99DF5|nr:hypothetical protein [uncultured Cohaesibacter sp.]